jgi:hypothetical protein
MLRGCAGLQVAWRRRARPSGGRLVFATRLGQAEGMSATLVCWKCGASLAALSLPLRRLDACKSCNAELHVCRLCIEYDVAYAKGCREPTAEEVRRKDEANFCDHFKPRPGAYVARNDADIARSKAALADLFKK